MKYFTPQKFSLPVLEAAVAKEWRTHGYSCALWIDPPGQEWLNYRHDCNELVTVVDGQLKILIDGHELIANPGDEVFIPKGAFHSVWNIYKTTSQWLYGYQRTAS